MFLLSKDLRKLFFVEKNDNEYTIKKTSTFPFKELMENKIVVDCGDILYAKLYDNATVLDILFREESNKICTLSSSIDDIEKVIGFYPMNDKMSEVLMDQNILIIESGDKEKSKYLKCAIYTNIQSSNLYFIVSRSDKTKSYCFDITDIIGKEEYLMFFAKLPDNRIFKIEIRSILDTYRLYINDKSVLKFSFSEHYTKMIMISDRYKELVNVGKIHSLKNQKYIADRKFDDKKNIYIEKSLYLKRIDELIDVINGNPGNDFADRDISMLKDSAEYISIFLSRQCIRKSTQRVFNFITHSMIQPIFRNNQELNVLDIQTHIERIQSISEKYNMPTDIGIEILYNKEDATEWCAEKDQYKTVYYEINVKYTDINRYIRIIK